MELTKGSQLELPENFNDLPPLPGGINPEAVTAINVASAPTEGLIELEVSVKDDGPKGKEVVVVSATQGMVKDLLERVAAEALERKSA